MTLSIVFSWTCSWPLSYLTSSALHCLPLMWCRLRVEAGGWLVDSIRDAKMPKSRKMLVLFFFQFVLYKTCVGIVTYCHWNIANITSTSIICVAKLASKHFKSVCCGLFQTGYLENNVWVLILSTEYRNGAISYTFSTSALSGEVN